MGSKSTNSNKRRHIYDELNRTIDSFKSYDNYSQSDDEIKTKRNHRDKIKKKYRLKKHKKINKELNKELIESSLLISDFLINNIINKNTNKRNLPDTNIVNSMILISDLFDNEEALKMGKQIEYCEQIINNGINGYKNIYKNSQKNKQLDSENKNNTSFDYINKNPSERNKLYIQDIFYEKRNHEINKTDLDNYKGNNNNTEEEKINTDNNKSFASILYKPKQIKPFINRSKNKNKKKLINDMQNIKSNNQNILYETTINKEVNIGNNKISNKRNFIRKKIFINHSPNNSEFKNKDKENIVNLSNLDNRNKYINDINNIRIYNNKEKTYKNKSNNILIKKNNISGDNIKNILNNKYDNKQKTKIIDDNNFKLSNTKDIIIQKKENFNDVNKIKKSYNFNIINKDSNINNIQPYYQSNNKIVKPTNINTINNIQEKKNNKNSLQFNNNIEFESEYRKSKKYYNDELNNNEKLLDNLNKSSLKDFINKQAIKIRQSPNYIKNKSLERKNEILVNKNERNDSKQQKKSNINNKNNIINNNNICRYDFNNIPNKNKKEIQNKNKYNKIDNNKYGNKKNNANKNKTKKEILKIDLKSLSSERYKK